MGNRKFRIPLTSCAALLLAIGASGCATAWDDVTSRDFHVRHLWERSDPATVLRESTDGDARAKALTVLKEPRANGGSDVEQDRVIEILAQSAVGDPQPLVRLSAVQTLGRFTDPRVVQILTASYDAAAQLPNDVRPAVQSAALTALGNTRQQPAIAVLVKVAASPLPADTIEKEINAARDVRLSAVRALKNFEGSQDVAAAMAQIVRTDRDVAVTDRARETYVKVTGREPAVDPETPATPAMPPRGEDVKLAGGTQ